MLNLLRAESEHCAVHNLPIDDSSWCMHLYLSMSSDASCITFNIQQSMTFAHKQACCTSVAKLKLTYVPSG